MGLSIEELELQSTDYLPAREVMSGLGCGHGHGCSWFQQGLVNLNDVNGISVIEDINILTGKDSDVVDIDNSFNNLF